MKIPAYIKQTGNNSNHEMIQMNRYYAEAYSASRASAISSVMSMA